MRELERQHDDKLNIIRSMAASNTNTPTNDYPRKRCQSEERILQEVNLFILLIVIEIYLFYLDSNTISFVTSRSSCATKVNHKNISLFLFSFIFSYSFFLDDFACENKISYLFLFSVHLVFTIV